MHDDLVGSLQVQQGVYKLLHVFVLGIIRGVSVSFILVSHLRLSLVITACGVVEAWLITELL